MDDDHFHFIVLDLGESLFQGLDGALHIGFHHDVQILQFPFLDPVEDIVQGNLGLLLFFHLLLGQAFFRHGPGHMFFAGIQDIPSFRHVVEPQDFHRGGRQSLFHLFAPVIDHGPDFAVAGASQDGIPDMQGAPVDEHGSYRASALIQLGFDDGAMGRQVGVGLQFQHIRHQKDHFQQVGNAGLLPGRNWDHDGLPAPGFRDQSVF